MNFFEHQDRARRNTALLVTFFTAAVVGIVGAVTLVTAVVGANAGRSGRGVRVPDADWMLANLPFLGLVAGATLAIILLASLVKSMEMRGGGGPVARSLGGRLLDRQSARFKERRLLNVVEEMALAAGVPVPEVYLLDAEEGINAFAAGTKPANAAIGVTRGAVDAFSREELQGVIAHEFSHILNGDMALNQKIIGILFGVLVLGMAGQTVLRFTSFSRYSGRRRDSDGKGAAAILFVAFGLMVIGYMGVFFGRLIKAAVSRQREFLADASAAQFTRNPQGLSGALKLIAVGSGSHLASGKAEEVSHMLFGAGTKSLRGAWATHPPLEDRIRALEPGFEPRDLDDVAKRWVRRREAAAEESAAVEARAAESEGGTGFAGRFPFSPEGVVEATGTIDPMRVAWAAGLLEAMSDGLREAAGTREEAPVLVLGLLVSPSDGDEIRAAQRTVVVEAYGQRVAARVEALAGEAAPLGAPARLPLLDLALPALRRGTASEFDRLVTTAWALIRADDRVDPFEFALAKTLERLRDGATGATRPARRRGRAGDRAAAIRVLLSTLAQVGSGDAAGARAAYAAGVARLPRGDWGEYEPTDPWADRLDAALDNLVTVGPDGKRALVEAVTAVIGHDETVAPAEAELLRAICATLDVPVPPVS